MGLTQIWIILENQKDASHNRHCRTILSRPCRSEGRNVSVKTVVAVLHSHIYIALTLHLYRHLGLTCASSVQGKACVPPNDSPRPKKIGRHLQTKKSADFITDFILYFLVIFFWCESVRTHRFGCHTARLSKTVKNYFSEI